MYRFVSLLLTVSMLVGTAHASQYTFPAKSVNLASALSPAFYNVFTLSQLAPATDFHPVHGIQLADGGYLFSGKATPFFGGAGPYTSALL